MEEILINLKIHFCHVTDTTWIWKNKKNNFFSNVLITKKMFYQFYKRMVDSHTIELLFPHDIALGKSFSYRLQKLTEFQIQSDIAVFPD